MERIYLSIKETGDALGLSRSTVYRLLADGELQAVKIGRRRLVKREAIAALVERVVIEVPAKE